MPHFNFDYSPNLAEKTDIDALLRATYNAALETGIFPLGGIRLRTHPADHVIIADDHAQNAYLHLMISVGAGRSEEVRKQAGDHIWSAIVTHLGPLFDSPHFALTMEIREIHPVTTWKKNAIHPRLKH